jgi:hypothetical protein
MHHPNHADVDKPTEEVARWDPEPALDVREEGDDLVVPLGGELFSRRRPLVDLCLGP